MHAMLSITEEAPLWGIAYAAPKEKPLTFSPSPAENPEIPLVGRHVGSRLVIIGQVDIETVVRLILQAEDEMAEQIGEER